MRVLHTQQSPPLLLLLLRVCARSPHCRRRLPGARGLHASAASEARILASDPIEAVCKDILAARGHELVTVDKTPKPEQLLAMIGEYEGLIVRR